MTAAGTIYALSSAPGRAGVAVIRVSGPAALPAVAALTGRPAPPARYAAYRPVHDPGRGEVLDHGLILVFPGPASFTGEDVAELHVHGGPAVVDGVLTALGGLDGLQPAEPGQFTRRAFVNGKMDLTEAEAVADLVDAETGAQRRQALDQLGGALAARYRDWADRLTRALAYWEAEIDFSDEEELGGDMVAAARPIVAAVRAEIAAHLADNRRGERLRSGLTVALVGPPNAGKSSLLNVLAQREAAIVAETAGTTRDVVEVRIDLAGYPVTVADTAGLRAPEGAIEAEGVRRAQARAAEADLRIALVAANEAAAGLAELADMVTDGDILVATKTDRAPVPAAMAERGALGVSLTRGDGLEAVLARLGERVEGLVAARGAGAPLTRQRHRSALTRCQAALERAEAAAAPELGAEEVRGAVTALGEITGAVDVEAVLDRIFRDFCIGK